MIRVIAALTVRALAGRRRSLLVALLAALPILIALLVRVSGRVSNLEPVTDTLMDGLAISTLVPLVALVFGTAALGSEIDDGTAIYLIAKPIERWRIVVAKTAVAAGLAVAVTAPAAFIAAAILSSGDSGLATAAGFGVGAAVAAALYATVFLALSLVTSRALAIGLIYVLVWEGVLAGLFEGTRMFSIHEYAMSIADAIAGGAGAASGELIGGATAVVLSIAVLAVALAVAIRRLQVYEIGEAD